MLTHCPTQSLDKSSKSNMEKPGRRRLHFTAMFPVTQKITCLFVRSNSEIKYNIHTLVTERPLIKTGGTDDEHY